MISPRTSIMILIGGMLAFVAPPGAVSAPLFGVGPTGQPSPFQFGSIDPATGEFSPVVTLLNTSLYDATFDPVNRVYYQIVTRPEGHRLMAIDVDVGVPSFTPFSIPGGFSGIQYDTFSGLLFGVGPTGVTGPFQFGSIDPATGEFSSVVPLLNTSLYDATFDPVNRVYYQVVTRPEGHRLMAIDVDVGVPSFTPFSIPGGFSGVQSSAVVPAPSPSLFGVTIGLLVLSKRRVH